MFPTKCVHTRWFLYYQVGFIAQPGGHKGDVYLDDIKVNHVPASGKCEVGMLKFELIDWLIDLLYIIYIYIYYMLREKDAYTSS